MRAEWANPKLAITPSVGLRSTILRVTLVEDDDATADALGECLKLEGINVVRLQTVQALTHAMTQGSLERVILCDHNLGHELVDFRRFATYLGQRGGPHALYLTTSHGFSAADLKDLQKAAGEDVYLSAHRKPLDLDQLMKEIQSSATTLSTFRKKKDGLWAPQAQGLNCV